MELQSRLVHIPRNCSSLLNAYTLVSYLPMCRLFCALGHWWPCTTITSWVKQQTPPNGGCFLLDCSPIIHWLVTGQWLLELPRNSQRAASGPMVDGDTIGYLSDSKTAFFGFFAVCSAF